MDAQSTAFPFTQSACNPLQHMSPRTPSLSPSSHATIFLPLASFAHNPQLPIKRIEKPSSCPRAATVKCFLIVCLERELGTAVASVMKPSSSCPGWPSPSSPLPSSMPPWPWRLRIFQNIPSLSSILGVVKSGTNKEGKWAPYLSYARNLFLQLPHARRYVNAPSAPTTALARGPGALGPGKDRCLRIGGHRVAKEPQAQKKRNKAVEQHKMRQQSKGQTAWNLLAKE